jgi:hypothetical protein
MRGLIFGGFGPIVLGIIFFCIEKSGVALGLDGGDILIAIVSTYILAFVQAGASVFNQIEHWPITKSILCHFTSLFIVYSLTYVINAWIPFEPMILVAFCLIFVAGYLAVWLTVYLSVKAYTKRLNAKIHSK